MRSKRFHHQQIDAASAAHPVVLDDRARLPWRFFARRFAVIGLLSAPLPPA